MSRRLRWFPAAFIAALLFSTACGQEQTTDATGKVTGLRPGIAARDAFPDSCTDQASCIGEPRSETVLPEETIVCKKYPVGVTGPAVQIKMNVVSTNTDNHSPLSLVFTVQPNACLALWWTGGKGHTEDAVTVEEVVPAGYTSQSQVTLGANVGSVFTIGAPAAPTAATIVTNLTGGPTLKGALVVFTNTPVPPALVNIGNFVWNDLNANGVQDGSEPGIPGVLVTLDGGAATATTDANGAYAFTNLPPGTHMVNVGTPAGFAASPSNVGSPNFDSNVSGAPVTVLSGTDNTIDFGFYVLGSLGDYVWNDLNANGVQDGTEPGIAGVTVTLSGTASGTAITDPNGFYTFPNLVAGSYTVTVATPAGFANSPTAQGTPSTDSNGNSATTTIAGTIDNTLDFGFFQPRGSLGDFVWNDLNANGVQDGSEPGIAGVTVTLSGAANATTVTTASGAYSFTNLLPGSYTVTVATPAGFNNSPTNQGSPSTDSNGNSTTTSIAGNDDSTLDFGFFQPRGSLGDFVWNDLNANGVQDGSEPGIAGVTVTLSGAANATTITTASGAYSFTNLLPGSYTVTVATPAGYLNSPTGQGTTANDSDGNSATTTIAGNTDNTLDFGFYRVGSIGNFVWIDVDHDGIQDVGEVGAAGVVVTLSGAASATTTTNASGGYLFPNLLAGTYTVTFGLPSGYTQSPTNAGASLNLDSNGLNSTVTIAGNNDLSVDYGIYLTPVGASCGYTQGYWKNHEEKWPSPYSPTATWMVPGHVTPVTWDGLMGMSVTGGNSYMQLAHQWIAATLNRGTGAPMSPAVVTVLDDAKAWLISKTPVSGPVPNFKDAQATAWASVLDNYNTGKLGTPHCN